MINNKGLYKDCNPIDQPQGTWRSGKNMISNSVKAAMVNEPGTDLTATDFPFAICKPMGTTPFPDGSYAQYGDGINGGKDRIGIVDSSGIYTDLIIDDILNFDASFPIRSSEIDYNTFGERIIGFTDVNNPYRVLNIDTLPFLLNLDKSLVNPDNINDIEGFPKFKPPIFNYVVNQIGGAIKSGVYSLFGIYKNLDGTRTPNSPSMEIIYITDDPTSVGADKYDGVIPGTQTPKSISINITNVDTRYDKFILGVIRKVNGITETFQVKEVDVTGTTLNIVYTGTETTIPLSVEEVLTSRPLYTKVEAITQLNSTIYLAGLESQEDFGIQLQNTANAIRTYYNTKLVNIGDLTDNQKNQLPGGFAHAGIYALYFAVQWTNGSWSQGFHIPGRGSTGNDLSNSSEAINANLPITTKVYQLEDTTNRYGNSYGFGIDGSTIQVLTDSSPTNMGYWENKNEVYPVGFPSFAGEHVRHHVFPTIKKCKQAHYFAEPGYGREKLDVLGLDVSNINLPLAVRDKIQGWAIFYAERGYINSNTLGTDIYLVAHKSDGDATYIGSAGFNGRTRTFDSNGGWKTDFDTNPDYLRGHNFELLKDKPAMSAGSIFLDFELAIRKQNLQGEFLVVGKQGGNLAKSGNDEGQNAGAVIDYTDSINTTISVPSSNIIRGISEYKYLPTQIIDGNIRTIKNEETIHMKIYNGTNIPFLKSLAHINSEGRNPGAFFQDVSGFIQGGEDSYLITYKQVKDDVFNEFSNQIIVCTDTLGLPLESSKRTIRGGDSFVSARSFISASPRYVDDFEKINGTTIIRNHITESRYNIGLRYEILGDVTTKYYPKTPAQNFWDNPSDPDENAVQPIFDRTANPNGIGYSNDYNETNKYSQLVIWTPNQRITNKFPYRVIRGGSDTGATGNINGWKTFLSADYYESNRNRGKITDIFVLDDNLFIHHYYGLFRTLGTEKLSLGSTEVYLGSGDIFSQKPKEPISTDLGFLGNQNIFAGVSFKGNRFWVDQSQGRVFLINKNGVNELSDNGMYNFFRDNLKIDNTYPDNPITSQGIIATYDPKFDRIILTKKSNVNPFTYSYSMEKEQNFWAFEHDYIPDYLFNTSTNFYGYFNNRIHSFNSPTKKGIYFEQEPKASKVEIIFNGGKENKEFFNTNWISEVYDSIGNLKQNKTLTGIVVKTSYQDSGEVNLIPFTVFGAKHNIRRFNNTWNFNKFKDSNTTIFKKSMQDVWCSITFIFDNSLNEDNTQNSLYLYSLDAKALVAEL